jgi:hypothetical protein
LNERALDILPNKAILFLTPKELRSKITKFKHLFILIDEMPIIYTVCLIGCSLLFLLFLLIPLTPHPTLQTGPTLPHPPLASALLNNFSLSLLPRLFFSL